MNKGLVAAAAILVLAGAGLIVQERVEAGPHNGCPEILRIEPRNGYWARVVTARCPGDPRDGGLISVDFIRDANGNAIPADEARPSYYTRYNSDGSITLVSRYRGDPSTSNLRYAAPRPPVNRDPDPDVHYQPGANHRAVQDNFGHCYREWYDGTNWRRSGSYGVGEEACHKAAWNTYQKSERLSLFDPRGSFPEELPPGFPSNPPSE